MFDRKGYDQKRYQRLRKEKVKQVAQRRIELRALIAAERQGKSCARECGENHPATLDFHHRDPREKRFTITEGVALGYSVKSMNAEIAKCDLVCSNCHRKEHWEERQQQQRSVA